MAAGSSKWFSNKSLKLIRLPGLRSKSRSSTSSSTTSSPLVSQKKSSKEEQLQQVFRHFDSNGDGLISCEELQSYFESVEFQEFVRLVEGNNKEADDDDLRRAFQMFEADKGSGCITPRGLQHMLNRLGDVRSHEDCVSMIRVFDLDGNGVLDFHEFRQMMASS
ncbi:probable calcium-binding protein CML41 [Pistacia vera]|uniref:probable calcium-binding protein CML41 n=1 Tax=Pistacia vera TaxID=55513 RepID=UPI001262E7B8|nr:probable calcium-binding protein CML41 [Pistacia vera]XP_031252707.1 probable calcium-binding protein CML41 [Pistacia vera]